MASSMMLAKQGGMRCSTLGGRQPSAGAATPLQQQHNNASRRSLAVAAAAKKKGGFAGNAQAAGLKVNSRGKVASRPGPPSRKQQRQMMEEQAQQQQMAPQADAGPVPQPAALQQQQQQPAPLQQQRRPSAPAAPAAAAPAAASMPVSTPQAVTDRMARRVAGFTAVPLVAGLGSLAAFWYLKVIAKVEYPMWAAYLGSTLLFGGSLAGITYGILSTSWDPRREGSFWGWTELRANIAVLMERGKTPGAR